MRNKVTFRPIDVWPQESGLAERYSPFRAGWGATLDLLDLELDKLAAEHIVIQLELSERDIRLDGWPRAEARPGHPGVILAFDSQHGPLKYASGEFDRWQDNLRAIALGLESLRRVDRYGITRRGEQYKGWAQLAAGGDESLRQRGRELIAEHGGETAALKATHPDHGGDRDDFEAVQAARG